MTLTRSAMPFPAPLPAESRFLLVDGARFSDGERWLEAQNDTETPIPVLADGQYDALSSMGPLLIPMPENSSLAWLWKQPHNRVHAGVLLHVACSDQILIQWLRARSQVRLADGRVVWFRLGDATVLKRLLDSTSQAPAHFWPGVNRLSVGTPDGFYLYQGTDTQIAPVLADRIEPCFQFNRALAAALGQGMADEHTEVS